MILETKRLRLREITQTDYKALSQILQDEETMYAYEGAFSDKEVQEWLDRQIRRYKKWGFGLWAVILKETGDFIGQCGLTMQPWKDQEVLDIPSFVGRIRRVLGQPDFVGSQASRVYFIFQPDLVGIDARGISCVLYGLTECLTHCRPGGFVNLVSPSAAGLHVQEYRVGNLVIADLIQYH